MGIAANKKWDRRAAAARGVVTTWGETQAEVRRTMAASPRGMRAAARREQRVVQPSRRGRRS